MATHIDASFPDVVLAPGTTITVTFDDTSTKITKLNVYGVTPAKEEPPDFTVLPPLLAYGPTP